MADDFDRDAFRSRLADVRREHFGDDGVARMASALGVPARTWLNYELGVTVPDVILLRLLCLTEVAPPWLLNGEGKPFPIPSG